MNRSSWASGSSNVPLCSIGFWVAITRNGAGSLNVSLPIVTRRSCMASSRALCTLGAARLISSASSRFVKIGPLWMRKSLVRWSRISEPMMSEGSRSTVNWIRAKWRSIVLDSTATSSVLASPGTPWSSRWPPVKSAISSRSTTTSWPTTTVPTRSRTVRMNSSVSVGITPEPCSMPAACSMLLMVCRPRGLPVREPEVLERTP